MTKADFFYRRWFFRGLRLSVMVALLFAGIDAYGSHQLYQAELSNKFESEMGYKCAARIDDAALLQAANEYGNINIKQFSCTGHDFYVSMQEVADVRSGKLPFTVYSKPFYADRTAAAGVAGFVVSTLVVSLLLGSIAAARWIWG